MAETRGTGLGPSAHEEPTEQQLWAAAVDLLPHTSIMTFDHDLRFLRVRGGALHDVGVTPAAFEGRFAADVLPAERWKIYRPMWEAAILGRESEATIRSPDGTQAFQVRVGPVTDAAGAVLGGVAVATDITTVEGARSLAEDAAATALARLRAAIDVLADPHALLRPVWDAHGTVIDFEYDDVNTAAAEFEAVTPRELLGRRLLGQHPDYRESGVFDCYVRAYETREPQSLDDHPHPGPGGGVPRRYDIRAVRAGAVVLAIWRDVTARAVARDALADAERRYRLIAENAADVVYRGTNDGILEWISANVVDVVGWRPEQLVGRPFLDFVHEGDHEAVRAAQAGVLAGEPARFEARMATASGGHRWMAIAVRPLLSEDGTVVGRAGGWRDIQQERAARDALTRSEAEYRLLAENSSDVVLRVSPDNRILWASPAAASTFGWAVAELVGRPMVDFIHPDDVARWREALGAIRKGTPARAEARVRCGDGSYRYVDGASQLAVDPDGVPVRIVRLRDIDEQHRAVTALAASERQLRLVMDSAPSGMAVVGLDRQLQRVNPALCRMLGRSQEWLVGREADELFHPDDRELDHATHDHVLGGGPSGDVELRLMRADGTTIWVSHSVGILLDDAGEPLSYVSQFADISDTRRAREAMRLLAATDPLTQLTNRREAGERLAELLALSRQGDRVVVLFCDLDGLKPVNDRYGHAAGDAVLVAAARRLAEAVRADDHVARIGGDEFLVSLVGVADIEGALVVADGIHRAFAAPFRWEGHDLAVTISIGVAPAEPGVEPDELVRRADQAMYRAKAAGGNATAVYEPLE